MKDMGEHTFWGVIVALLVGGVVVISTYSVMASYATERYGMDYGYCQAQNLGGSGYRWVKCSDPR